MLQVMVSHQFMILILCAQTLHLSQLGAHFNTMQKLISKTTIFRSIQTISVGFLLYVFLIYFGHPAWEKYKAKGTLISEKSITNDFKSPPAITICPKKRSTKFGWKADVSVEGIFVTPLLKEKCLAMNLTDITECVNKMGYSFGKSIISVRTQRNITLGQPALWREDIVNFNYPKCFTLILTSGYGIEVETAPQIILRPDLNYAVHIHYPAFFLGTINPKTIPKTILHIGQGFGTKFIYIEEILNKKLDWPTQPCKDSLEYSFTKCLRNSIRYRNL